MLSSAVRWSNSRAAARRFDEGAMRLAHALRLARRARRVQHHRHVVRLRPLATSASKNPGLRAIELAADLLQLVEARHAARNCAGRADRRSRCASSVGTCGVGLQHLVDLLLVLDDRERDLGIVQHEHEFGGRRVLVHRHRHAAQRLRRGHRPVQARPVVADDREMHAAPEALRGQPAGERAHFRRDLAPGPGLPDAEILFARGRVAAAHVGVVQQETGKRIQFRLRRRHCLIPPCMRRAAEAAAAFPAASAVDCLLVDSIGSPGNVDTGGELPRNGPRPRCRRRGARFHGSSRPRA